ncbi:MAG: glycine cleavage system protein GcvH, partial [Verrucomicrobiota bacterium]
QDRYYTKAHEWIKVEGETAHVGITEHAQEELGDITFIEMPEVDEQYEEGADCAEIESVKAASDIYMPVAGTIAAINEELEDSPEKVNEDPYKQGWLFQVKDFDAEKLKQLMDAEAYSKFLEDSQ